MMTNNILKSRILGVVDKQLAMNNPRCVKETLTRLKKLGYSEKEAKEMIASVLLEEITDLLKNHTIFNEKRYKERLNRLR